MYAYVDDERSRCKSGWCGIPFPPSANHHNAAGTVTQDDNGEIHIFPLVFNKQEVPFRHCKEGAQRRWPPGTSYGVRIG